MRLRRKPWIDEAILDYASFVFTKNNRPTEDMKGKWRELFGNNNPLYVELGTGKGKFITETAKCNPHINFIGIELQQDVIFYAAKKVAEEGLTNVKLLVFNIEDIGKIFDKGEVDRFYINFCDPWPKARHAKRRLTYRSFLKQYHDILVKNGQLHFKTDNRPLFDFSLEEFKEYGLDILSLTYDLHASDNAKDNIMTEYEAKFSGFGEKINRCEASFPIKS